MTCYRPSIGLLSVCYRPCHRPYYRYAIGCYRYVFYPPTPLAS